MSKVDEIFLSPNKIKFNWSLGKSLIDLSRLILYFLANCFACVNTLASLASPNGAIPPPLTLKLVSGINKSMSIAYTFPNPLQVGQAPYGELKEKLLGEGVS